jgi:superfamily II DNA or RNA helicase
LPTGCGKTFTFAILVQRSVEVGERALVIAHRTELLDQAADELREFGLRPQIEQGPHRASLNALVVVASVQTLRGARLARFPRDHFGLVIVDECHHAITQGYRTILDHFTGAA